MPAHSTGREKRQRILLRQLLRVGLGSPIEPDWPARDMVISGMNDAIAMLMKKHGHKAPSLAGASDDGHRFKVSDSAMAGAGICDGDTVLVDDQIEAKSGYLVLISRDGLQFEVRILFVIEASTYLHADDANISNEES